MRVPDVERTASRIPGTARTGATETTGFDGGIDERRQPDAIASSTPGAGFATSAPRTRRP